MIYAFLCFLVAILVFLELVCVGVILNGIKDLKHVKPIVIDNKPANLEGKLEYNEVEIYSEHIKGELHCFIKYSYSGQVVSEKEVYDFAVSWPDKQNFNFKFSGMTGYI